jgi:hypothetical protein
MTIGPAVVFKTKVDAAAPRVAAPPPELPRGTPANYGMVCDLAEAVRVEISEPLSKYLEEIFAKLSRLEAENNELKTALIEARHEVRELKLIQESLRISTRGESGRDGARGVPGRDGPRGGRGERGLKGERGKPAPVIVGWMPRPARFEIAPIYENGQQGPPLSLLSLFQAYNDATSEIEDADLEQAAADSRQVVERNVASHWAR